MKWYLVFVCVWMTLFFSAAISKESQHRFYSEAPIEFRNGVLYSSQITIGFKNHSVIQALRGRETINGDQVQEGKFKVSLYREVKI